MLKRFWCECSDCGETWVSEFLCESGILTAADEYGEECTVCASAQIEIQDEYVGGDE